LVESARPGWKVRLRCTYGKRDGMKSVRECPHNAYLDLATLLWTRGRDFTLAILGGRLKCLACGSREMSVMFIPPAGAPANDALRGRAVVH
jgi:hypothetical protein